METEPIKQEPTTEELRSELDRTDELYWNAVDRLGELRIARATLMNQIRDREL